VRHDATGVDRIGRIVEVEAYDGPSDLASHARFGRTARTAPIFGPAGHLYAYLVYGMYDCLNIVAGPDGSPSAILIRAVEPIAGLDAMRAARLAARRSGARSTFLPPERLASGPGLVGIAFGIDRSWSGVDLLAPDATLRLETAHPADPPLAASGIVATRRIGVEYAGEAWAGRPWRFVVAGNRSVSRPVRS
jgi:DNA-3-methyladenine glycosylase